MRHSVKFRPPVGSAWRGFLRSLFGATRGTAAAAAQRQADALRARASAEVFDFWTGKTAIASAPSRKGR